MKRGVGEEGGEGGERGEETGKEGRERGEERGEKREERRRGDNNFIMFEQGSNIRFLEVQTMLEKQCQSYV